ncbi:MAG: hypothetical protein E7242_02540 [Lachnospiraceae bacterium]|nr:hypothetical protein [Lachnospiraceae bacterium]
MSLKSKFFVIFFLVSAIPMVVASVFLFNYYTNLNKKNMLDVYDNICKSASVSTQQSIETVKTTLDSLAFYNDSENSIINDIKKYSSGEEYTSFDVLQSNKNIKYLAENLIYSSENLNGIFIFTSGGQLIGYGNNIDILPNYNPSDDNWYKETVKRHGRVYVGDVSKKDFIIYGKESIIVSKALYSFENHEFLGVLMADFTPDLFNLNSVNPLPHSVLISIENNDGNILYSNVDELSSPYPGENKESLINSSTLNLDNIKLSISANPDTLYKDIVPVQFAIVSICIVYVIVCIFVSIMMSVSVTTPISTLSVLMSRHKLGNFAENDKYLKRSDEIGTLYNEYNSMIEEQEKYITSEYKNKLISLDSQMKSLEAQIDSHFLFNTLETINSLAELNGVDDISNISISLGNMLRYSIKAKSELVTVSDELANVDDYITIQKIRFNNKFKLITNIDENILNCRVLKLTFQPLVENALQHGLLKCEAGDTITISSRVKGDMLYFDISDNGVGINENQLEQIRENLKRPPEFKELGKRSTQSIGLKNISSRIELYYGAGFGLIINSKENEGTKISIKFPLLTTES